VFKITPAGKLTTLYTFCSQVGLGTCSDGIIPYGLVQGTNGNFYGVTLSGGAAVSQNPNNPCTNIAGGVLGCGTIFEITAGGTLTTLYRFCSEPNSDGSCPDGQFPQSPLALGTNGDLYGTLPEGGPGCNFLAFGCGSIFKITPGGSFNTIYSFCSQLNIEGYCSDGAFPEELLRAANGNFYGTTEYGGTTNGGTIFEISPAAKQSTLYSFCDALNGESCPDGSVPMSLSQANDGNFYGTTADGGVTNCLYDAGFGCGTIFKITPKGVLTTLYSFCPTDCYDGVTAIAARRKPPTEPYTGSLSAPVLMSSVAPMDAVRSSAFPQGSARLWKRLPGSAK
jgi:uncharacterized repeat protein (TIGR03803 family)